MNIPEADLLFNRLLFTFASSVFFGQILQRAALDWFAFSPTHTSLPGRWLGAGDIKRWILSGAFLLLLPLAYFAFILAILFHQPAGLLITPEGLGFDDAFRLTLLVSLVIPYLGLYDIWQATVRRWPNTFYSKETQRRIQKKHKTAFNSGIGLTYLIACILFFGPLVLFFLVLYASK